MKRSILIALILFNYAFAKAQTKPTPQVNAPQIGVKLGYGEMADFGDTQVKFVAVVSDSRCPKGVQCVWAGEAKVKVEVFKNGKSEGFKEITFGATPKALEIIASETLGVQAMYLKPYPDAAIPKENAAYYLLLNVTQI